MTTTKLTRAAGVSAVAGGLLFIAIQFIHLPVGVALAGLGYSLTREQRIAAHGSATSVRTPLFDGAGAE
jgi:hypothetical protein